MTTSNYASLSRAQLSYEYLHTNSTTHEFLFGALAELVDNARDANATKLSIFTLFDASLRGNYMLCFLDDGEGMQPGETADIITFGRSSKRSMDDHLIGMYGNGLKSGSMRIGNDLMVFSKKNGTQSCMFLSRSFHEKEKIDEVIVPLPSFKIGSQIPLDNSEQGMEKFAMEMDVILRHSPFKTDDDFFAQFDRIEGESGTLVIVYNMKLLDSGDPELDILSDPNDILLTNPESDFDSDDGLMIERKSFRAYVAILYMDPRMKVHIQGKKVRTKRLASCLYKPKLYKYSSNRFKSRAETDAKKALDDAKGAELRAKEAQSKAKDLESKSANLTKGQMAELRKAQQYAAELKHEAQIKKDSADRKYKQLKEPKVLNLIFGINIEQRSHDGVFVYNCSRLIKMYEKVGPQVDGGVFCSGVVGIVNVPYYVLEPTHNKQDFADAKEYRHLMKVMGEHMVQYWKDLNIAQQGVLKFWESFGYVSQKWKDPPSDDSKFVRKRSMQVNVTLQCDSCLKWRTLPFSSGNIGKDFKDEWTCNDNPENQHNRCSSAEQKLNIAEGVYKKENKTQDEKKKDLEEEIKRKTELLEKMHKNRVVTSSREVQEMERKKDAEDRRRQELEEKEREEQRKKQETENRQKRREQEEIRKKKEAEDKKKRKEEEEKRKQKEKDADERRKRKEVEEQERQRRKDQEEKKRKKDLEEKEKQKKKDLEAKRKKKEQEEKARAKSAAAEQKKGSKRKIVEVTEDEEEEEEEEEELEDEVKSPVKKSRAAKKEAAKETELELEEELKSPAKKGQGSKKEAVKETEEEEAGEEEDSTPRRRGRSAFRMAEKMGVNGTPMLKGKKNKSPVKEDSDEDADIGFGNDMDFEQSDMNNSACSEVDNHSEVGTRVEALVNKKWYPGTVQKVNDKEGKWKVKFDNNKRDKYDKWFEKNSPSIKLLKSSDTLGSPNQGRQSPTSQSSLDTANEAPSSSTGTGESAQLIENITNGYRTCLRYFLPPQWMMDKDSISGMTPQELATFPLDDFFDHYEKGLRKLVNNFQTEASLRTQEADAANAKLKSVRKMIAKLLTSSNEEFNIDPDCDGEQVDEFLLACLQASNSKTSSEGT